MAIVAAAYRNWGVGCVERLAGEWSLAIVDGGRHRLVLARDRVGSRPLVWARDGNDLVAGSEVGQVARLRPGSPQLNEAMAAEFLVGQPTSPTETLVLGVERLPPASVLVAENGAVRTRRYWDLSFGPTVTMGALDLVRDAVTVAVGRRLEHRGRLGVEVSGGLDSSLVAGLASRAGPIVPLVIDHEPGTKAYERPSWQAVTRQLGVEPVVANGDEPDVEVFAAEAARSLDVPLTPEAAGWSRLMRMASERDVRVVLTGQWGDEWFRPTSAHLADALWRRSWPAAWQDSALWAERAAASNVAVGPARRGGPVAAPLSAGAGRRAKAPRLSPPRVRKEGRSRGPTFATVGDQRSCARTGCALPPPPPRRCAVGCGGIGPHGGGHGARDAPSAGRRRPCGADGSGAGTGPRLGRRGAAPAP